MALLGCHSEEGHRISLTGLSPAVAGLSRPVQLSVTFVTPPGFCRVPRVVPRPRYRNDCSLTRSRFGLVPFRSPLLRKSLCFLFLEVLRCFSSLRWPPTPMYSVSADGASSPPGFPIRTSSDQSSLSSSPRLIAASHVLHRLSAPKHPPCTLYSLIPMFSMEFEVRSHELHGHASRRSRSTLKESFGVTSLCCCQGWTTSIERRLPPNRVGPRGRGARPGRISSGEEYGELSGEAAPIIFTRAPKAPPKREHNRIRAF